MKQCDKKSLLTLCLGAAGMSLRLLQNMTGFEPGTGLPIPGSICLLYTSDAADE